jgi:hypothetical protein
MNWNPTAEPFRVGAIYRSSAVGHHGWRSGPVHTFATLDEAEAFATTIPMTRMLIRVVIDEAVNAATWNRNGRWKLVRKIS